MSFAYWASSVSGNQDSGSASLTIGTWPLIPEGFIGVAQNNNGTYITLNQIGTSSEYPLNGNYILVENINWNNNAFTPIGGANGTFSGTFLGNGYRISNINITTNQAYVGLFARNSGTIEGLSLTGLTLNVSTAVDTFAGGIAGENSGIISKSYVTGSLTLSTTITTGLTATHNVFAGGIAGTNTSTGTISDSHANVNVSASLTLNLTAGGNRIANALTYAGGLVGRNSKADGVIRTYANGSVSSNATATASGNSTGNATVYSGGLVGHSNVTDGVRNSFATGSVTFSTAGKTTNTRFVGGLNGLGNAVNGYRLNTQSVTGETNTIGTVAFVSDLKSQTFMTQTVLFSLSVWSFDGINYPRIIDNLYT
jgi:hypothetical protein